jgi:hypothetical protein
MTEVVKKMNNPVLFEKRTSAPDAALKYAFLTELKTARDLKYCIIYEYTPLSATKNSPQENAAGNPAALVENQATRTKAALSFTSLKRGMGEIFSFGTYPRSFSMYSGS